MSRGRDKGNVNRGRGLNSSDKIKKVTSTKTKSEKLAFQDDDEDSLSGWEDEVELVTCLFSDHQEEGCPALFAYMKATYAFDFEATRAQEALDFYQTVKMINFIRTQVKAGVGTDAVIASLTSDRQWRSDETYLKPVMADDALLFGFDDDDSDDEEGADGAREQKEPSPPTVEQRTDMLHLENQALRQQVEQMGHALQQMRTAYVRSNNLDGNSAKAAKTANGAKAAKTVQSERNNEHSEKAYFSGYSGLDIHEEMLKDTARTCAYRDFMYKNSHLFNDKVVLDIGCGTGILSMFAARAGAKQVIGIDAADIIDHTRTIVKANNLDHVITLVKAKVEEATLPVDEVDIIVSEWMGYFLLFESMLPSVLFARDKWMKKGGDGGVYPNKATMSIAGIETNEYQTSKVDFWKDVYGFDMTCLRAGSAGKSSTTEAVNPSAIITKDALIKSLDMLVCKDEELDFDSEFTLAVTKTETMGAFVVWFDCGFDHLCQTPVVLGTGPHVPTTHWYQTLFYLESPLAVQEGDVVTGKISASRQGENHREYDVVLEWHMERAGRKPTPTIVRTYTV